MYFYYKLQKIIMILFTQSLEDNRVKHGAEALYNVWRHQHFDTLFQMALGILTRKEITTSTSPLALAFMLKIISPQH